jgi:hypothetical protein
MKWLILVVETNRMDAQACFRDSIEGQAFLQGQLRRGYREAFKVV